MRADRMRASSRCRRAVRPGRARLRGGRALFARGHLHACGRHRLAVCHHERVRGGHLLRSRIASMHGSLGDRCRVRSEVQSVQRPRVLRSRHASLQAFPAPRRVVRVRARSLPMAELLRFPRDEPMRGRLLPELRRRHLWRRVLSRERGRDIELFFRPRGVGVRSTSRARRSRVVRWLPRGVLVSGIAVPARGAGRRRVHRRGHVRARHDVPRRRLSQARGAVRRLRRRPPLSHGVRLRRRALCACRVRRPAVCRRLVHVRCVRVGPLRGASRGRRVREHLRMCGLCGRRVPSYRCARPRS
jgi:hypothetical protein